MRERLMGLAERITGNPDDAADAVQEAFCRLWAHRAAIATQQAAQGMSVVTVRNASIDTVRRRAARPTVELDEQRDTLADDSPPPDRQQAFNQVQAIIDLELTETQRTIVRLREYEGRSFEEIAQRLEMQPATVRMQLSRARKQIRETYYHRNNETG